MADKPHSKRTLDIVSLRNGARSKKRPDTDFRFTEVDLTNFAMPLYRYSWKGYGHNNALWHTMKKMNMIDNNASTGNASGGGNFEQAGDCILLSCLPGRQVYAEFNALPLMNIYNTRSGNHSDMTTNRGLYNGYAMPLCDLIDAAYAHNKLFPIAPSVNSSNVNDIEGSELNSGGLFRTLFAGTAVFPNSSTESNRSIMTRLLDQEICYEGGSQSHKFTNITSLPVYIEVREFMPKVKLSDTWIYDSWGSATNGYAGMVPGIRETINSDLVRQKNRQTGVNNSLLPEKFELFDELDDKAFKYNKYCKITNERFVVGEAVHHRIDPGHTWTYTMVLPAFRIKTRDLFEFVNMGHDTTTATDHTDNQETQLNVGVGSDGTYYDLAYTNYSPMFSKFISVRASGSTSFTQGPVGTSGGTMTQVDTMNPNDHSVKFGDIVKRDTIVNGDETGTYRTYINPAIVNKVRSATHAVALMHEMHESHGIRVKPCAQKYFKNEYNWLPNNSNRTEIKIGDEMGHLDPLDNQWQDVAFDS